MKSSAMKEASQSIRPSRLRPFAGRFDLVMNNNQFGLKRRTIRRAIEPLNIRQKVTIQLEIKNETTSETVPLQLNLSIQSTSHSISKASSELNTNNSEGVKRQPVPIFAVKPKQAHARQWNIPERPKQNINKEAKKPMLYDTSKPAVFKKLTEESLFVIFNQLTLNELVNTAGVCNELKVAAQKFFEVIYTTVNMEWLIDDGAEKFTLIQAQRLLQCFGNFISTLIVNTDQLDEADEKEKLLEIIEQHCAGVLFWDSK